jgi:hypothetical protein
MVRMIILFAFSISCQALKLHDPPDGMEDTRSGEGVVFDANMRFAPTQGKIGILSSKCRPPLCPPLCEHDEYKSSPLEQEFRENINSWAADKGAKKACAHMEGRTDRWINSLNGTEPASLDVFSNMCKKGHHPQLIEPLAGVLRDPRFPCAGGSKYKYSIEWLLLADNTTFRGKKLFFDAGGTRFSDATMFFANSYEERGLLFDHIYVWEAQAQGNEAYWEGVPAHVRAKWEPRVTFYNGIPVSAEKGHTHNVVERIFDMCGTDDFCAFKLDIDTPSVELPLAQQLLANPQKTSAALNEFFFEHHVHGSMQYNGWGEHVDGTFADSIDIFTKLRQMGVRSHSWI